jgi:chitinase
LLNCTTNPKQLTIDVPESIRKAICLGCLTFSIANNLNGSGPLTTSLATCPTSPQSIFGQAQTSICPDYCIPQIYSSPKAERSWWPFLHNPIEILSTNPQPVLQPDIWTTNPNTNMSALTSPGYRSVVYYTNWAMYGRKHFPWQLPAEKLTHILYSFANIKPDGEIILTDTWSDTDARWTDHGDTWEDPPGGKSLFGCLKQLFLLKKRNRNLKILLSIGGWSYKENFSGPCSTPEGRATFVRTSIEHLKNLGFDGIDVDWEYPKNDSEAVYQIELFKLLRSELDAYSATLPSKPHFLLTIASPAGPSNYNHLRIGELSRHLDFINLMAYDYAGSWEQTAGHQANLYTNSQDPKSTPFSTQRAVEDYIKDGVDSRKIVLGMPLYGRSFANTDGPGSPFQGTAEGDWEQGTNDYKVSTQLV